LVVSGLASLTSLSVMGGAVILAVIEWYQRDRGTNAADSR